MQTFAQMSEFCYTISVSIFNYFIIKGEYDESKDYWD